MTTGRAPNSPSRGLRRRWPVRALLWLCSFVLLLHGGAADAQQVSPRLSASYRWTDDGSGVLADFTFHQAIDGEIRHKLSRGLPTVIVFTGLVYVVGQPEPISTTIQTCRVTWHVWEEMYRIELTRSNSPTPTRHWSPTVSGVNRRCAQADGLLIADRDQLPRNRQLFIRAKLQINPLSSEVHSKIKRWISRPARTRTVTAGSALFSTFTGLFMQRISDAERTIELETTVGLPRLPRPMASDKTPNR